MTMRWCFEVLVVFVWGESRRRMVLYVTAWCTAQQCRSPPACLSTVLSLIGIFTIFIILHRHRH